MSNGINKWNFTKNQQPQWNTQGAKGKVSPRCLWNACKAFTIGLALLTLGTSMAIVGYYADALSIRSETRGNSTVSVKNEDKGFHLNNLSYVGPIVMGIGGFIVVAACVMTFEARDSAAKVVPARFRPNLNSSALGSAGKSGHQRHWKSSRKFDGRKNISVQADARAHNMDFLKSENVWPPKNSSNGKKALYAATLQNTRTLTKSSSREEHDQRRRKIKMGILKRFPSAPELIRSEKNFAEIILEPRHLIDRLSVSPENSFGENRLRFSWQNTVKSLESKESIEMDSSADFKGSQGSMALDLHECQVTLKVEDESAARRSNQTSKKRILRRQKPVEEGKDGDDSDSQGSSKFFSSHDSETLCHCCCSCCCCCSNSDWHRGNKMSGKDPSHHGSLEFADSKAIKFFPGKNSNFQH